MASVMPSAKYSSPGVPVRFRKGSTASKRPAEVVFTDHGKHGVLDGAHSLAKIVDELIPWTYGAADDSDEEEDADLVPDALQSA